MRHTWHADQETTVLLHFCHHLPADFVRIPIWMGGLDFLSISSPLTVSQQKAPSVRFLLQRLITRSGRERGKSRARPRRGERRLRGQYSEHPLARTARMLQTGWRTRGRVGSTNATLSSVQSPLLVCVPEGPGAACGRQTEGAPALCVRSGSPVGLRGSSPVRPANS